MSSFFSQFKLTATLLIILSLNLMACAQKHAQTSEADFDVAKAGTYHGPPVITRLDGSPVTLVSDGSHPAPIMMNENASPAIVQAANDLAFYIEKMTGAKPQVLRGTPDPLPATAIWVGYQPVLETLFPEVDFEFKYAEEILIGASEGHVVIVGRDVSIPGQATDGDGSGATHDSQLEYGTANAVYTFIQDQLGVRWLWPGDTGLDIVRQETLVVEPFIYRYHPQVRARTGLFNFSGLVRGGYGTSFDWVRHQRLALDSLALDGGHAFRHWWKLYHETHPEYFALQPDGTRSGYPSSGHAKLCQSNPAVWDQWLKNVEEILKKDPARTVFSGASNDGYASGVCVCPNCRAWDHMAAEKFNYDWNGIGQSYVAMSDRYVTFANHLAARLKERYPDKDYYVLTMAYGFARPAPIVAVPADNVIISYVGHIPWRKHRVAHQQKEFGGWARGGRHLMFYRPNTGSEFGWQQGLPEVMLEETISVFAFLRDHRNTGIFIDTVWEHWGTQAPQYYLMAQLTWNPYADGHKIIDDFYTRGFGPAARPIRQYWQVFEDARIALLDSDGSYISGMDRLAAGYNDEVMKAAYAQLELATQAVAGSDQKYIDRVAFVKAGFRHSQLFIQTIPWMNEYKRSMQKDEKLAQKVRDHFTRMNAIAKAYPYVVNPRPIRPVTPRMRGTHPDHLPQTAGSSNGSSAMVSVTPNTSPEPPACQSAEEQGWTLVFSDDFERTDIGDQWKPFGGTWAIQDGKLQGGGGFILTAKPITLNGKPSFQRIEFDATPVVKIVDALATPDSSAASTARLCDISPMLQAHISQDPKFNTLKSGYFFQFGGFWNKRNQIRQSGVSILLDDKPAIVIKPGVKQHFVAENDYGHLKLFVDGKLVYHLPLEHTIMGGGHDRAGVYLTTTSDIDNVRIYAKPYESGLDTE